MPADPQTETPTEPPPGDPRLVPVLVAVGYLASLITLWGMLSLILNRDAITETDAGPLLGPAMALSAGLVVAVALWGLRRRSRVAGAALAAAASVYLAMLVVGSVGYLFTRGDLTWLVLFSAKYALSPFILGAAILGGAAVLFLWATTYKDRRAVRDGRSAEGSINPKDI